MRLLHFIFLFVAAVAAVIVGIFSASFIAYKLVNRRGAENRLGTTIVD
jgi:hypothetical protein